MIETLLASLLGGAFRLAPEALKWLDRKGERSHELAMFDKQLAADKLRVEAQQKVIQLESDAAINASELQAIIAATEAQAVRSGVKWVDGLSALMRPLITFWWVIVMYSVSLAARFWVLVAEGTPNVEAIIALWGADEKAIVASIISFWFVDRSLRKSGLK